MRISTNDPLEQFITLHSRGRAKGGTGIRSQTEFRGRHEFQLKHGIVIITLQQSGEGRGLGGGHQSRKVNDTFITKASGRSQVCCTSCCASRKIVGRSRGQVGGGGPVGRLQAQQSIIVGSQFLPYCFTFITEGNREKGVFKSTGGTRQSRSQSRVIQRHLVPISSNRTL